MLALYIIFGILLLLFLLLIIPLYITLDYNGNLRLDVGYMFFKTNIIGDKNTEKEQKTVKSKTQKPNALTKKFENKDISEIILQSVELLKIALDRLKPLVKHIIIREFYLALTIGSEDAEITALTYGRVCAVVYPMRGILAAVMNFKENKVFINADFNSKKSSAVVHVKLNFRPIFAVIAAFSFIIHYIIVKIEDKIKNKERVTDE